MTTIDPRTPESGSAQPVWPPQQLPAPGKKSRLPLILAAIAVLVIVIVAAVVTTLAVAGGSRNDAAPQTAAPAAAGAIPVEGCGSFCDDPTPAPAAGPLLTKADVELSTKTTEKHCFGSAGCNLTLKVLAGWTQTLSADETWEVTYEIRGVEDGPLVGTFEITGDKYESNSEIVSTTSSKSKVTIKVTEVEKVGL